MFAAINGRQALILSIMTAFLVGFAGFPVAASAEALRKDARLVDGQSPVYVWKDAAVQPRAVAIAIHGLTLHGAVYDKLAKHLAREGFLVFAPDLRGYGRLQNKKVCYDKSYHDLVLLSMAVKRSHPRLPIYLIGESLGADMALRLASENPNLTDGLVLSSPAVKRRYFLGPIASEAFAFVSNPFRQVNLKPYIGRFFSEDPRITQETLSDPLVRKHLTAWDLLRTCSAIRPALKYADKLTADMPVLIIQGSNDRMLRSNAVALLERHLKSTDQTVRWFNDRGHLLLETDYLKPDTVETLDTWLDDQLGKKLIASQKAAQQEASAGQFDQAKSLTSQ